MYNPTMSSSFSVNRGSLDNLNERTWCVSNRIQAKRADTSVAWINSIFLVMNLLILLRLFFVLCKKELMVAVLCVWKRRFHYRPAHPIAVGILC